MRRVLIVEDNEAHRELVESSLQQSPPGTFAYEFAGSLTEARECIEKKPPELILLDLSLPDSHPTETLPKALKLANGIPIIVLTSLDDRKTIMGMIQQGAKDCLPKIHLSGLVLERSILFCLDRERIIRETIEQQRQLERASSFRNLFDRSRIGFVIGTENAVIIEANPAFAKWLGYEPEELHGMSVLKLTPREFWSQTKDASQQVISGKSREVTYDKRYLHRDGHEVWGSVIIQKLPWPGHGDCILASIYDLTSHKEAEEKVEAALQRETEANKAKTALMSMLGHDIRSPITNMIGLVELLKDSDMEEADEQECLDRISTSGRKLLDLIDDIVEFSRVESGRVKIERKESHIPSLIDSLQDGFKLQARDRGVHLKTEINLRKEAHVIDADRTEQILTNFLSNALKFTKEGGTITLHASDEDHSLNLAVEDTGIGIEKEDIHHLFKPFSQANNAVHNAFGGTGLGLSICKQLADLMDGQILLQSTPGKGSTFTLVVPVS